MSTYKFEIKTGDEVYAGTDSNIFLILKGNKMTSREVRLNGYITGNAFERNQTDKFEIPFEDFGGDCGKIYELAIRSDCKYLGSDWLLSDIKVKRVAKEETNLNTSSTFQYDQWIKDKTTKTLSISDPVESKYVVVNSTEICKKVPLFVPSKSKYNKVLTEEFEYSISKSEINTIEVTTEIKTEIEVHHKSESKAEFEVVEKLAKGSSHVVNEAILKMMFNKKIFESKINEYKYNETRKFTTKDEVTIDNSSSEKTKNCEVLYYVTKTETYTLVDGIFILNFKANTSYDFGGVRDLETNEMLIETPIHMLYENLLLKEQYIGDPARHHLHIGIKMPHYKEGNNKRTQIDIGYYEDYNPESLQAVIDYLHTRNENESGRNACIAWCEDQLENLQ